jgi:hypothetical protein
VKPFGRSGLPDRVTTPSHHCATVANSNGSAGFLVRDVAANSDVYGFERGACPELGLKLKAQLPPATTSRRNG